MVCYWLFGIWIASLVTAFSVMASSNTAVLIGTGALAFGSYLIGLFPKAAKYLPTALANGNSLIYGASEPSDYTAAIIITTIFSAALLIASVPIFNKKQL